MKPYFFGRCWRDQRFLYLDVVFLLVLLVAVFLLLSPATSEANNSSLKGEANIELLHGGISENELIDYLERLGIKCIIHQGASAAPALYTLNVEKVHLGSSAYYGGILAGDIIKDLHRLNANTFSLSIERAGKIYQIHLNSLATSLPNELSSQTGQTDAHMQSGIEYARNLLYGHASDLNAGIERTELARQMASVSALKSSTLLQGEERENLLQGSTSMLGLSSDIHRFAAHIEMVNPSKASFLNINLCMAPPTDPYGKLQWNSLIAERNKSSALGPAWDRWEHNLGDYICRYWARTHCSARV